jgi:soluble lytic murein transglycosylase
MRQVRLLSWLLVGVLVISLIVFLLGPALFASIAYPLPQKYQKALASSAQEFGISPNFLAALIQTESSWHETSRSGAGAVGLTQVIPSTAVAIAGRLGVKNFKPNDLISNPELAIRFGAYYISDAINRNGGNKQYALIAYNGGQGAVSAAQRGYAIPGTVAYAHRVLTIEQMYDKIYGTSWWTQPDLPSFTARPKSTELVGSIPVVDFWTTFIARPSSETTGSTSNFNDFWQNLVPGQ